MTQTHKELIGELVEELAHKVYEATGMNLTLILRSALTRAFKAGVDAAVEMVPEEKEHDFLLPEDSVTAISVSAHNACRAATLKALAELKKDLMRQAVWDCFQGAVYISGDRHTEIREVWEEAKKRAGENPMAAI